MKLIHPRLVAVEEGDNELTITQWLLDNTTVKPEQYDSSVWGKVPTEGDVIMLDDPLHAVWRWSYSYREKGEETSTEERFKQVRELLVAAYGEAEAQQIVARLAREHQGELYRQFGEFYTGGRVDPLEGVSRITHTVHEIDKNNAVWVEPHDTTTE